MTKYQMIFVKIEVYLVNFKQIVYNFNYPLTRFAFSRIKLHSHAKNVRIASTTLAAVGKLKRAFVALQTIEKRKHTGGKCKAFSKLKDMLDNSKLLADMRQAKQTRIKQMKEQLIEKKEEIDYLSGQLEDTKAASKGSRSSAGTTKQKESDLGKSADLKKIQTRVARA